MSFQQKLLCCVVVFAVFRATVGDSSNQTICQGKSFEIKCENEAEIIKITDVFYGRNSATECREEKEETDKEVLEDCKSEKAMETVENICKDLNVCKLTADNQIFENTCPNSDNYLMVKYECVKKDENGALEVQEDEPGKHEEDKKDKEGKENKEDTNNKENTKDKEKTKDKEDTKEVSEECKNNEHKEECASACQPTCFSDPKAECTKECVPNGCACDRGHVRDPVHNQCILASFCPLTENPDKNNEEFTECNAYCDLTCTNPNGNLYCRFIPFRRCFPGYVCKEHFVRNHETGKCVPPTECPDTRIFWIWFW